MTKAGWIFMLTAWTAISVALAWCFYLVLKKPGDHDAGPPSGRM